MDDIIIDERMLKDYNYIAHKNEHKLMIEARSLEEYYWLARLLRYSTEQPVIGIEFSNEFRAVYRRYIVSEVDFQSPFILVKAFEIPSTGMRPPTNFSHYEVVCSDERINLELDEAHKKRMIEAVYGEMMKGNEMNEELKVNPFENLDNARINRFSVVDKNGGALSVFAKDMSAAHKLLAAAGIEYREISTAEKVILLSSPQYKITVANNDYNIQYHIHADSLIEVAEYLEEFIDDFKRYEVFEMNLEKMIW